MDDLKQSVQNAVYEQKDPLLIYKFEAFELFKQFLAKVNEENISFLLKAEIPVQDSGQVREAQRSRSKQKLNETKEESRSLLAGKTDTRNRPPQEKSAPVKSEKIFGRNERVTVQYTDGTVKEDVKYKAVEEDIKSNKCVVLEK